MSTIENNVTETSRTNDHDNLLLRRIAAGTAVISLIGFVALCLFFGEVTPLIAWNALLIGATVSFLSVLAIGASEQVRKNLPKTSKVAADDRNALPAGNAANLAA